MRSFITLLIQGISHPSVRVAWLLGAVVTAVTIAVIVVLTQPLLVEVNTNEEALHFEKLKRAEYIVRTFLSGGGDIAKINSYPVVRDLEAIFKGKNDVFYITDNKGTVIFHINFKDAVLGRTNILDRRVVARVVREGTVVDKFSPDEVYATKQETDAMAFGIPVPEYNIGVFFEHPVSDIFSTRDVILRSIAIFVVVIFLSIFLMARSLLILGRTIKDLNEIRKKQEEQVLELDNTTKLLVRRDRDLLRANDELLEIDKAKSQFVSIAAHQLRTPLSVIKWTFRMLLSGDFGILHKEQKKVLQRGYDTNENMIKLVSNLLDVARIESGRFRYRFEEVSLEKIIKDVVEESSFSVKERGLTLTVTKASKGKMPSVWADKEKIRMVLQNLISNAINYTLREGKIEVIYKKRKDVIEVQIKDTGVGIPTKQKIRLFTKFFRGDNVMRMQTQGTGLGLYIVASIITAHKGQVGFDSQEGKGSTFWFTLPINTSSKI